MSSAAQSAAWAVTRQDATPEQRRTLAQMELRPSRAEEITRIWRLTGPLDAARLDAAIGETVRAHDMLRARLVVEGEQGAFLEIFVGFDGLTRQAVDGGPDKLGVVVDAVRQEPLTARSRWFQAVLCTFAADSHALVVRMHHSLVDGYSMLLVEREIWDRYGGDTESLGDAPPAQYGSMVRADVDQAVVRNDEEWWARQLAGARAASLLPSSDATGAPFEARELPFALPAEQTAALRELARANRTSLTCVLLTAHLMTIATFANDPDVVTAVAYLNRDEPGLRSVVGPLVNLVPIRAVLPHAELADNLPGVTTALRQSIVHARVPYDRMVASTGLSLDGDFGLVRSAFSMSPGSSAAEFHTYGGLRVERVAAKALEVRVDLAFTCAEDGPGLRGALVYRADLYGTRVAESVRDYFCSTISRTRLPAAGYLSSQPQSSTGRPSVAGLVSLAAFGADDPVAQDQQRGIVGRREFVALVTGYAAAIPGDVDRPRVALALGSSVDQAAALVATWRRGGSAVLIDPRHPAQRRAAVLASEPVDVLIDRPREPVDDSAAMIEITAPAADDVAYVVHTSGTDGVPKGVAVTYRNLEHLLSMLAALNAPVPGQNPLGPAFDGWIWATLLPWVSGKPVVFLARGVADATALVGGEASSITLTPTMLAGCDPERCPATVISAGEPLTASLAARFTTTARLINAYGPTEATVCASWADTARDQDPTTIGGPAPGVSIHVLDRHARPVPVGAIGEIHVGGPGVALGYLNQPGLTASRFVADPHGAVGSRRYRTGDLATVDAAGTIRFVGRKDGQVKVSGVRIELDEVGGKLCDCPGVREAAAVRVDTEAEGPQVWAAVVLDSPPSAVRDCSDEAAYQEAGQRLLPEARPTRIFAVRALPLTSNGKLDRERLRESLLGEAAALAVPPPAQRSLSERVAAVWEQVLSVPVPEFDKTFFEYGGHSLAAARVIRLLRLELGRPVPAFALYNHPTVRELSVWLEANP